MRTLANSNRQGVMACVLLIIYTALGMFFGIIPNTANNGTFAGILLSYANEQQTRSIMALILINALTAICAALRVNTFDTQRLASFMLTNVIAYLFGNLLFWLLFYFGLRDILPMFLLGIIIALVYGAIMASLTVSIYDNIIRAIHGTTPPSDASEHTAIPSNSRG